MTLAVWPRLVAFKDRLVEAYVRGMAAEQAERHPVPPLGTCALCGRSDEPAAEAHARGVAEERHRWTRAIVDERWVIADLPTFQAKGAAAALDNVVRRIVAPPDAP